MRHGARACGGSALQHWSADTYALNAVRTGRMAAPGQCDGMNISSNAGDHKGSGDKGENNLHGEQQEWQWCDRQTTVTNVSQMPI